MSRYNESRESVGGRDPRDDSDSESEEGLSLDSDNLDNVNDQNESTEEEKKEDPVEVSNTQTNEIVNQDNDDVNVVSNPLNGMLGGIAQAMIGNTDLISFENNLVNNLINLLNGNTNPSVVQETNVESTNVENKSNENEQEYHHFAQINLNHNDRHFLDSIIGVNTEFKTGDENNRNSSDESEFTFNDLLHMSNNSQNNDWFHKNNPTRISQINKVLAYVSGYNPLANNNNNNGENSENGNNNNNSNSSNNNNENNAKHVELNNFLGNDIGAVPSADKLDNYAAYLNSDSIIQQFHGCQKIRKLVSKEVNPPIEQVVESGAVGTILQFFSMNLFPRMQFEAAWVITNICSSTHDFTMEAINLGALDYFVHLMKTSKNIDIVEQCMWGIGNIAGDCPQLGDMVNRTHVLSWIGQNWDAFNSSPTVQQNAMLSDCFLICCFFLFFFVFFCFFFFHFV